jgi:O-acetyl-ADP-ribose deacetylase
MPTGDRPARLTVVRGSIVDLDVDAIVNAANSSLQGGGGVDGAIHRAAGPGLAEEARRLAPCPPGEARITAGHRLRARHVIHTVGPVWHGGSRGEPETLARCYTSSLALAEEAGCDVVAFPAISTGIYGYPAEEAARVAVEAVAAWLATHDRPARVLLCAFSANSAEVLERAVSGAG